MSEQVTADEDLDAQLAEHNRGDVHWIRRQIMQLANHTVIVRGVEADELRRALHAIHAGRPWRGVLS